MSVKWGIKAVKKRGEERGKKSRCKKQEIEDSQSQDAGSKIKKSFLKWEAFLGLSFRFLLAEAVETAEAPDNVGAVDANNLAVGEALGKYVKCFIVVL